MEWYNELFARGVVVSDHDCSCVDSFVAFVLVTTVYTPLFNVLLWKEVGGFSKGVELNIMR